MVISQLIQYSVYHCSFQFQFYCMQVTVNIIPSQKLNFQSLVVYFYVLPGLASFSKTGNVCIK